MRSMALFLALATILGGCRHSQSGDQDRAAQSVGARNSKEAAKQKGGDTGSVKPIFESVGKVASVNPDSRFVIIDFTLSQLPALEKRMGVYRQEQKVGEVKISGPARDQNIAADIVLGDAKVGDEVRPD
jgi:hypothetical protein